MTGWKIEGQYMETCNCNYICPCITTNMAAKPSEGSCKAAIAMKIDRGVKDGIKLDGLAFIVLLRSPGPMIEGGMKVGLIIDERADTSQTEAIAAIASGAAGGPMANLAPLVSEVAGIEKRPITFSGSDMSFSVRAGELVDQEIQGVGSMGDPAQPMYLDNTAHPANKRLALAKAVRSVFNAFGISWKDSSGTRNGHFAPFSWAA